MRALQVRPQTNIDFGEMRLVKDDPLCTALQVIDLVSAVKGLHGLNSQELGKLLKDSEDSTIYYVTEKESRLKIDVEKLASSLPLHLIAVLMSSDRDESLFRYLTCGIRLLHTLCDLAPRHAKLEQILLDDVKVSEQLLDLVFYILIVFGGYEQKNGSFGPAPLMHSAVVACSLHLLIGCISSQWRDLVQVLLAHPKVDIFMDAAFGAVCASIKFLNVKLLSRHANFCTKSFLTSEQVVHSLCQQCEASLQFLQLLCQQKMFRERVLRNKELCGKGGVLFLAQAILKLNMVPHFEGSARIVAAVSRLKAKILAILLNLCEAESISYLDEVASSPGSLDLAKSVALEIIELLKCSLGKDPRCVAACTDVSYPMGLSQLNAMRLADILSDDSNFRSYITIHFTKVLTAIFSLPHKEFLSSWCSSERPVKEEDGTIDYDSFATAGWVMDVVTSLQNTRNLEFTVTPSSTTQASYVHQRTSLFVKIIANLHCFVPTICEEQERNLFANKFMECLQTDPSNSDTLKAATISRNLCSLLTHAESLIPNFLNEEDVQLLRVFSKQFESLITPMEYQKCEESKYWDRFANLNVSEHLQSTGGCPLLPSIRQPPPIFSSRSGNMDEIMSESSAFQKPEQLDANIEHMDQEDDAMREDKGKSGRGACRRFTAIDRDAQNVDTSGSDTSSTRMNNAVDSVENSSLRKLSAHIEESGYGGTQEDEKTEPLQYEEKQRRKRKRTIMNDEQVALVERALLDEPDMQRNAASLQSWAEKLSFHGTFVTSSQLKNWLNNRKARLARTKDFRATPMISALPDKQGGRGLRSNNSPESSSVDASTQLNVRSDSQMKLNTTVSQSFGTKMAEAVARKESVPCLHGGQELRSNNSPGSPGVDTSTQQSVRSDPQMKFNTVALTSGTKMAETVPHEESVPCEQGGGGLRSNNSPESPGVDASAQLNVRSEPEMKLNTTVAQASGSKMAEAVPGNESVPFKQVGQGFRSSNSPKSPGGDYSSQLNVRSEHPMKLNTTIAQTSGTKIAEAVVRKEYGPFQQGGQGLRSNNSLDSPGIDASTQLHVRSDPQMKLNTIAAQSSGIKMADAVARKEFGPYKQGGRGLRSNYSSESPGVDVPTQPNVSSGPQMKLNTTQIAATNFPKVVPKTSATRMAEAVARKELVPCKQGDAVLLQYNNGEDVGIGKVFQAGGQWFGRNLEELRAYVVDIKELQVRRAMKIPYPSMATGGTFEETETKIGVMRVLWDSNRTFKLPL